VVLAAPIAVVASLLLATSASAADVLDAHCGDPTNAINTANSSNPRYGQTFTALNTGQLTSATVNVSKSSDQTFSMEIRPVDISGVPDASASSALATESVPAPASGGFVPLTANFSSPASVVAGQLYALVVERTTDSFSMGVEDPAVLCEGDMWLAGPPGPVWQKNCTPDMPPVCRDMLFTIHVNAVEPPPTPPPTPPNTTAPTGQRAAALAKCKKKKSKQKRKKCKKRANLLPV